MIALLIIYLLWVAIWFVFAKLYLEESYEASIVMAVFHPVMIVVLYVLVTGWIIVTPIYGIVEFIKTKKASGKNDN